MEQGVLEQCYRNHQTVPKAIREAPQLDLGLEFTYSAFWELSSCRPMGWGFGPIPMVAIFDYAQAYHLDAEEFDDFVFLIRSMDKAFLDYHSQKAAQEKPSSGSK